MKILKKVLGINLKYYRNLEGLSQYDFYTKYHLSPKHLANVELGKENVSLDFVDKVARKLNLNSLDLLTFDKDKVITKKRVDERIKVTLK